MTQRTEDPAGAVVLLGEAVEDWTGDAAFYEYSSAADPVGSGAISPVPVHRFPPTVHAGGPTRAVPLDLADRLGVDGPATSPGLLASFMVIRPGEDLVTLPDSTSELYYCLRGSGHSAFACAPADGEDVTGTVPWRTGDFVTLPAGCTTVHRADGPEPHDGAAGPAEGDTTEPTDDRPPALLYRVTDAPLLRYLGVAPSRPRFRPTRFDGAEALARLAEVEHDPEAAGRSRVSILLGNAATPQTLTVTHTLWAMLGILPVDRVQLPHRHQSVALDLITACAPGCYSLVGHRLDSDGAIVDPVRVDWEPEGAFVTPPGMWHSHHNESGHPAYLVPIQDAGLHTYLRSLDIRFTGQGG
jgi:gentisate 1,2-dioxygenase